LPHLQVTVALDDRTSAVEPGREGEGAMMVGRRYQPPAFTRATPLVLGPPPRHSVAGRWRGWWVVTGRSTAVALSLTQSGSNVFGMLSFGPQLNNTVRGVVDDQGFVRFEGTDLAAGGCTTFQTVGVGLAVSDGGRKLDGPLRSRAPRTGPGPRGTTVETVGTITLARTL
jgi:hypothetical protein